MMGVTKLSRREFLKASGVVGLDYAARAPVRPFSSRRYQGSNFIGWEIVVGDGVYAAPGEPPVSLSDIATIHHDNYSELRANVRRRRIMAHNITLKRIIDDDAFEHVHTCGFRFRLPYLPSVDNPDLNAQTLEGGIFVWDGSGTRLDYGAGFQWMLNPWKDTFGEIRAWTDANGGQWERVGYLTPNTQWHEIRIVVDFQRRTTSMKIDDVGYPSCFTGTPKPETWGTETAARFQAEIISVYPEPSGIRAMHKAEFQDWVWVWEPQSVCRTFMPFIRK